GDRLTEAVARRNLEVEQRRLVAADLDHVQHEVRAVDRLAPVEVRGDPRRGAALRGDVAGHRLGGREPVGVDVVERDLDVVQLGEVEEVSEQVARELDAAGAYEG